MVSLHREPGLPWVTTRGTLTPTFLVCSQDFHEENKKATDEAIDEITRWVIQPAIRSWFSGGETTFLRNVIKKIVALLIKGWCSMSYHLTNRHISCHKHNKVMFVQGHDTMISADSAREETLVCIN
jgi:hypothetical protein